MSPSLHVATVQEAAACYGLLHDYADTVDTPLGSVSWNHPQTKQFVHDDAAAGRLYAVKEGAAIAATFAVCADAASRFAAVQWEEPGAPAAYLHRLAVAAPFRGAGLGKWCVAQAEQLAAAGGYRYLRLDALPTEVVSIAFYHRLGYIDRGSILVESGEPRRPVVELVCFERRVRPGTCPSNP